MVGFLSWDSGLTKHIYQSYTKEQLTQLGISKRSANIIIKLQQRKWENIFLKFSPDHRILEVVYRSKKQHPLLARFDLPFSSNLNEILDEITNNFLQMKVKRIKSINQHNDILNSTRMPEVDNVTILKSAATA